MEKENSMGDRARACPPKANCPRILNKSELSRSYAIFIPRRQPSWACLRPYVIHLVRATKSPSPPSPSPPTPRRESSHIYYGAPSHRFSRFVRGLPVSNPPVYQWLCQIYQDER